MHVINRGGVRGVCCVGGMGVLGGDCEMGEQV